MKIIKAGQLPIKKIRYFCGTCGYCRCQVEVSENEAQSEGTRNLSYSGTRFFIICPTENCNNRINLTEIVTR